MYSLICLLPFSLYNRLIIPQHLQLKYVTDLLAAFQSVQQTDHPQYLQLKHVVTDLLAAFQSVQQTDYPQHLQLKHVVADLLSCLSVCTTD